MRPGTETSHMSGKVCGQQRLNLDQETDGRKTLHHLASV